MYPTYINSKSGWAEEKEVVKIGKTVRKKKRVFVPCQECIEFIPNEKNLWKCQVGIRNCVPLPIKKK